VRKEAKGAASRSGPEVRKKRKGRKRKTLAEFPSKGLSQEAFK
jgi:hypothetical protein